MGQRDTHQDFSDNSLPERKRHPEMQKHHYRNPCLIFLNVVFMVVSIGFIGAGVWMARHHSTSCVNFLQGFLIGTGFFMLLVAMAGLVGSFFRIVWLVYLNFVVMFVLLLVILGTTIFVLVVTSHGITASVARHGGGADPLSRWFIQQVDSKFRQCTRDGQICRLVQEGSVQSYYNRQGLSALQVGCCEPPQGCNTLMYTNASMGQDSATLLSDCQAWGQASNGFCSHCSSCRAAVAENIRHLWHEIAIFKVIALLLLIPTYFLSCCYFKQDEASHHDRPCQECLNCCYSCLP